MDELEYHEKFDYMSNYIMKHHIVKPSNRPSKTKSMVDKLDNFNAWVKEQAMEQDTMDKQKAKDDMIYNTRPENVNCTYDSGNQPSIKIGQSVFHRQYLYNRFHLSLFQTCYDFIKSVDIAESLFEF